MAESPVPQKNSNQSQELSSPPQSGEKKVSLPATKPQAPKPAEKITVHDTNLIASMQFMHKNNFLAVDKSSPHFDSVKEAEDYAKESVTSAVKEKINALKSDISELQKAGYELHLDTIKLLHIPLKVKVWTAHPVAKDLEAIYAVFAQVEPLINTFKKELEQKLAAKEKIITEQETAWEAEVQQRKQLVQELSMSAKPAETKPPQKSTTQPVNNQQNVSSPSPVEEKKNSPKVTKQIPKPKPIAKKVAPVKK